MQTVEPSPHAAGKAYVTVLLLQGPYANGGTLTSLTDPALLAGTIGTDYGRYVLTRLVLLLLCGGLLLAAVRSTERPQRTMTVPGVALLGIGLPVTWIPTGKVSSIASARSRCPTSYCGLPAGQR